MSAFFIDCQTGELRPLLTDAPSSCNNSQRGESHIEIALDNPGMFRWYICHAHGMPKTNPKQWFLNFQSDFSSLSSLFGFDLVSRILKIKMDMDRYLISFRYINDHLSICPFLSHGCFAIKVLFTDNYTWQNFELQFLRLVNIHYAAIHKTY